MMKNKFLMGALALLTICTVFTTGCDLLSKSNEVKQDLNQKKQAVTDTVDYIKEVKAIHDIFTKRFIKSCKAYHDNLNKLLESERKNEDAVLSKAKLQEFIDINKAHLQELDAIEEDLDNLNIRTKKGNEMREKVYDIVDTQRQLPKLQLQLAEGNVMKLIENKEKLENNVKKSSDALEKIFKDSLK